jgi:hypothetical protein
MPKYFKDLKMMKNEFKISGYFFAEEKDAAL